MRLPMLAARLYGTPLLIEPAQAVALERTFATFNAGEKAPPKAEDVGTEHRAPAAAAASGARMTEGGYYRTADGIAMLGVLGPLVQRASGLDAMCGIQSYESIAAQLDAAMRDEAVKGVFLEVDSPGGEAAGVFDLGERIAEASKVKPIVAHANEYAFSAAYALLSAAGEAYVAPNGMVGSVGVIMMHVDQSGMDAKRGVVYTPITYGAHKADLNPHAPLTETAEAWAQEMVDRLGEAFVAHVATARGIDAEAVRGTEAALLHPDRALELGMIDGALSSSNALSRLRKLVADRNGGGVTYSRAAAVAQPTKESTMDKQDKGNAAADELVAKAKAEGVAEGAAQGAVEAKVAERARIKAITTHEEAKGRETLAAHLAHDTDMTAEQAIATLKASPKVAAAAAPKLADKMAGVSNPDLGAGGAGGEGDGEPDEHAIAARVVANATKAGVLRVVKK